MNNTIREFSKVAEKYCLWAESLKPGEDIDLGKLLKLLSDLLTKVLAMPYRDPMESDGPIENDSKEDSIDVHKWFAPIKFQYYREIFNPHDFKDDEPVTGDLHEDLADIYCDLKPALSLYKDSRIDDAAFEWKSTFGYHWGEHLVSALRAIYMFER